MHGEENRAVDPLSRRAAERYGRWPLRNRLLVRATVNLIVGAVGWELLPHRLQFLPNVHGGLQALLKDPSGTLFAANKGIAGSLLFLIACGYLLFGLLGLLRIAVYAISGRSLPDRQQAQDRA